MLFIHWERKLKQQALGKYNKNAVAAAHTQTLLLCRSSSMATLFIYACRGILMSLQLYIQPRCRQNFTHTHLAGSSAHPLPVAAAAAAAALLLLLLLLLTAGKRLYREAAATASKL